MQVAGNSFRLAFIKIALHHHLEHGQSDLRASFSTAIRWEKVMTHPASVTSKGSVTFLLDHREPPLFAGHCITRNHRQVGFK